MAGETLITLGSTLVGYVGLTAVGGIIESVSGDSVLRNLSKLHESLKKYKPVSNHEIQEAVLRSYLQATLQVCVVYGEGLGISANVFVLKELLPRFFAKAEVITRKFANLTLSNINIDESLFRKQYLELPNDIKTKAQKVGNNVYTKVFGESPQTLGLLETPIENLPDEKKWLKNVIEEYTELLTQLTQKKLAFPEIVDNPELNELLGEEALLMQAKDAKQREDIISEKILQRVEKELADKFGKLPPGYRQFFLDKWFNYFCGCFHYQLARNAELARKFQSTLLADIEADTHNIINVFDKFSGEFGERLKGIEENLAWLENKQEQGFDEIKQLLLSMMPLVATINDPSLIRIITHELNSEFRIVINEISAIVKKEGEKNRETTIKVGKETQQITREVGEELKEHLDKKFEELIEADKKLTPEERKVEKKTLVEEYLRTQIKKFAAAEIVGDVYASDKFFVDREEEQRDLPEWLTRNERIVVIKGISGNGKTALMTEVLRKIAPDDTIINNTVKGILTFYFRDVKGELIDVNLLEICRKVDARLTKAGKSFGFGLLYEEFKKSNPLDIPIEIIEKLSQALNALGDIWIVFDNFESALKHQQIKNKEIEYFIRYALATQSHLRFLITAQIVPQIPDVQNIKLCSLGDLPPNYAKDFLLKKGVELKASEVDCGLAEATDEQFSKLFDKLLPSPIALVSFVSYLKTLCETDGKVFADVLADETLFVAYQNFDADDRNKGARIFIKRQFQLLSELEQLILRALSIFPQAIEFPVLQSILPLTLEKETLLSLLKGNSLVRKVGNNRYELHTLPKEIIRDLPDDPAFSGKSFHLKAAEFYDSIRKPKEQCYTREDFALYFSAIDHFTKAESYDTALFLLSEDTVKLCRLGYMNEIISRSLLLVDKLGELNKEANNFNNLGLSFYSFGKLEEAVVEYNKAIKILERLVYELKQDQFVNELAFIYLNKGVSLENLGKLEEAITEYDKAIKILERLVNELKEDQFASYLAVVYLNKGVSLRRLSKWEEAIAEYNKAIEILERLVNELEQDQFANELATAYMNKGNAFSDLNKLSEAIENYGNAINLWEESLQTGNVLNLPNLIKAFGIRILAFIKLEDWQNVSVDVGRAFDLEKKYKEHLSVYVKKLIGQEISEIMRYLKEVALTNREMVYANLGKFAELVKGLVEQS